LPHAVQRVFRGVSTNAFLLLVMTAALWGGNGVASRMAVGQVSPMTLVLIRWIMVCVVLAFFMRPALKTHWGELKTHWRTLLAMSAFGFTGFNILFYLAGYHTTAINITLLQSSIPPIVMVGAYVFKGARVTLMQFVGMMVTLIGVALIAAQGDVARLSSFHFNYGDVLILIACVFYAGYTVALRGRPPLPSMVFFTGLAIAAFLTAIPPFVVEVALGQAYWPTLKGWAVLTFIALGPSLASQVFYIRGVELIGPGRAGLFSNLVPPFGALFAVLILGEEFHTYHALAMMFGLGGIFIAERFGK